MATSLNTKSALSIAGVSLLALTACGGSDADTGGEASDESVTLDAITMVLPNVPSAPAIEWFYDELEERSEGRITVEQSEPEAICPAPEIAECVRDGRADIGVSISDYSDSLFPSVAVAGIPFMVDNPQALMGALYEVNTTNESAQAQWDNVGVEYMGAWSPGTTIIGTNGPLNNIDDLDGLQLRAIGSALPSAFDMVGANVVSMPAAETYENIERGVADAVSWTFDGPVDYQLMEQLDTWTDPGVGAYTTFAMWMNQDVYNDMPDDLREIVDEVREEFNSGVAMEQFAAATEEQCTQLIEFPNIADITAWDEADSQEWENLVQEDLIDAYISQAESDGLDDATGYFEDYTAALETAAADTDYEDPVAACITRFEDQ